MAELILQNASGWLRPLGSSGTGGDDSCCSQPGEELQPRQAHRAGCMVCGTELNYLPVPVTAECHYCGKLSQANARCSVGHFVCDRCHSADPAEVTAQVCLESRETDAVALMQSIRSHPRFGVHGPEHHFLVPAVILAALRNSGQVVPEAGIWTALQRGKSVPGGACAFLGTCGAAIGAGIAVSILLEATPYEGRKRQLAQQATQRALERIASFEAPRCCQRDAWLALREAARFLEDFLGKHLKVDHPITCDQMSRNKECIQARCPLWPTSPRLRT